MTTPAADDAFPTESDLRREIATARKIVVKLGSSALTKPTGGVDRVRMDHYVEALEDRMSAGSDVVVVSSGAIATGMKPLGLSVKPQDLATKQAAAAVGQVQLAEQWSDSFGRFDRTVAQVLLTASDAGQRDRARNAQRTIERLRQLHTVPIINENDTVATSEMRFGDNDRLAAIVAHLISADALILLSDVDGLYDRPPADPAARFVPEVRTGADLHDVAAGDGGRLGTGGMAAKVSAARLAARGGVPVLLTSAERVSEALSTAEVGTVFHPRPDHRLGAWKFWALYAADAEGVVRIDAGAMRAVTAEGASLLPVGVLEAQGEFHRGDIVEVIGPEGQAIGRGEVGYDATTLASMIGRRTAELPEDQRRPIIHADYLSNYASRV
ncbi:glutamate 5-kinase [Corynebacterium uterequi]|uniref:Glutamate 5-kinase n=1 Tax=Corynebacterium uterequi TaxID=1072256 RepID=A0A0G3HKJ7_9CORY|nr:glutamate 5-kinase [Corynebacterium uterequi]AKK11627.1 glutamate 5-kinase [Corynebacterium uterequi]